MRRNNHGILLSSLVVLCFLGKAYSNEPIQVVAYNSEKIESVPLNQALNLVSWNTKKFSDKDSFRDFTNLSKNADFFLVQEAIFSSAKESFFNTLPDFFWLGTISFIQGNGSGTGVQMGSRFRVSTFLPILSRAREPITGTPKAILLKTYPIAGMTQELMVANIHGINFVTTGTYNTQLQQLETAIQSHRGPLIVAGDFNTHLGGRMRRLKSLMDRLALKKTEYNDDHRFLKLDHILYRQVGLLDTKLHRQIKTSDHSPLSMRFVITQNDLE